MLFNGEKEEFRTIFDCSSLDNIFKLEVGIGKMGPRCQENNLQRTSNLTKAIGLSNEELKMECLCDDLRVCNSWQIYAFEVQLGVYNHWWGSENEKREMQVRLDPWTAVLLQS